MGIKISYKRFKKNYKVVKKIYNCIVLLLCFCDKHKEEDEDTISCILTLVEYLSKEVDKLYYDFFNIENGLNENGEKV